MPSDKVTLAIIGEKLDNIHAMQKEAREMHKELREEVKLNTEFRLKFKGVLAAVSVMSATITAFVLKFASMALERMFR